MYSGKKKFSNTLKFYVIQIDIIKYLTENFFFVSQKGLTALKTNKQIEIISMSIILFS